jgi:hypothetical protein
VEKTARVFANFEDADEAFGFGKLGIQAADLSLPRRRLRRSVDDTEEPRKLTG